MAKVFYFELSPQSFEVVIFPALKLSKTRQREVVKDHTANNWKKPGIEYGSFCLLNVGYLFLIALNLFLILNCFLPFKGRWVEGWFFSLWYKGKERSEGDWDVEKIWGAEAARWGSSYWTSFSSSYKVVSLQKAKLVGLEIRALWK